jgi:hypothetical protein
MATLVSPGVSVSVIDESVNPGQGPGTVPFILIATQQDKVTPDGADVASGTTKASAGVVNLITSQRELLQTFGEPNFLSVGGSQINGSPLNEYGLLAAYSYMGIANRAYVVRADIDLAELEPSVNEPTSPADVGTYWLDTDSSEFGIFTYNATDDVWEPQEVKYLFNDDAEADAATTVGNVGDFGAIVNQVPIRYVVKTASSDWEEFSDAAVPADYQAGAVWPTLNSGSAALADGDIWVKTVPSAQGADFITRRMSATTGQFESLVTPLFVNDAAAETYYGAALSAGDIYIQYLATSEANFVYRIYDGSAWSNLLDVIGSLTEPTNGPADGALWHNQDVGLDGDGYTTVDILVNNGTGAWENVNLPGIAPSGGIPTVYLQSSDPQDNSPAPTLLDGDIWVDTDQLDEYPVIYKWNVTSTSWVLVDNTDQTTNKGILFADARPNPEFGTDSGVNNGGGANPDLDPDVPDPDAYPAGMLLWNTRFSTMNVKEWNEDYVVDGVSVGGRWVNRSGNQPDGSPYMGEAAQRQVVVQAMQSVLVSNEDLRAETVFYNLIATPGFPETINEMITLNTDRGETAFIIGDTPMDLSPTGSSLQAWATNANLAAGDGQDGLVSASPYLGVYYPSGLTSNLDGTDVVVPPSHMALRTLGYNDQVGYPWFSPAGLQRGGVTNAAAVGYIDGEGEFVSIALNKGQRDVLYVNGLNPIRFIPNAGLHVWGQKTRNPFASALDRINVARLINYIRYQADIISLPFLFQPNDSQTRREVTDVFNKFFAELVTLRGVGDFLVVCDESNNTPARIDRNELWIDIAIQPIKSIEFIYIPIRIRNTGEDLSS